MPADVRTTGFSLAYSLATATFGGFTPAVCTWLIHPWTTLLVTMCIGLSNFIWLPVMGAFSDRIGRKPLLLGASALALLTAYPALSWLVREPSFAGLLGVELWLSFLYSSYNGAMVVALTEVMPADVRTTGFSLACWRRLRWFHPGGLHLADPHPGQPRGSGHLAQWRGAAGAARHPGAVPPARQGDRRGRAANA